MGPMKNLGWEGIRIDSNRSFITSNTAFKRLGQHINIYGQESNICGKVTVVG